MSPNAEDVSKCTGRVSPNAEEVSKCTERVSPNAEEVSKCTGRVSPNAEDVISSFEVKLIRLISLTLSGNHLN